MESRRKKGAPPALTYPSGRNVTQTYNGAGQSTQVTYNSFNGSPVSYPYYTPAQGTSPTTWGYAPSGTLQLGTYGNGVQQSIGHNTRLQLTSIALSLSGQTLFSKTYNYADPNHGNADNGNIIALTDNLSSAHNQSFGYDQVNRLISGSQSDGAFNQSFALDPWGNLQQSGTWNFQQPFTVGNRIAGAPANCTAANLYCYDAAGDLLNDGVHTYSYDAERRLSAADSAATYTYGSNGDRVRKDANSSFTEYIYFNNEPIAEKTPSGWADYVFGNGQRIAMATGSATSATQYYHADHLGSERLMTNASGAVISSCLFAPFGQQVSCSPDNAVNHYRFTGKERDNETGLDDLGARYYENVMGRFGSPDDPDADQDQVDPRSWNLYSYVRTNPVENTDLMGGACVQGPDGKWHDDDSGGESCAQVEEAEKNRKPAVTVTAQKDPIFVKDDFNPLSDRAPLAFQGFVNLVLNGDVRRGAPQLVIGLLPAALGELAAARFVGPVVAPGLEAAANAKLASLGLSSTTAFNVGKGVLNGETTGISAHALNEVLVRGVTSSEISEALTHVPKGTGGSVLRFIGQGAEVRVNQINGKIVTVIRFSGAN